MFRGIGGVVEKKIKSFTKDSGVNDQLNKSFDRFLSECFPEGKSWNFKISLSNDKIAIQTLNKTVASELILRVGSLSKILKEEKLIFKQIIIR